MNFTYDDYSNKMRAQGKAPVSEDEFNSKKEDLRYGAENARYLSKEAKSKSAASEGGCSKGFWSFISGFMNSFANQLDKYSK